MFEHVVESIQNTVASLNGLFRERMAEGRVLSSQTEFDHLPGSQRLTSRQIGVVKVSVWELWQTALSQSLLQGRPIIYDSPAFNTNPHTVDLRTSGNEKPHVHLMYFGDEFDATIEDNTCTITFHHKKNMVQPTATIDDADTIEMPLNGIELRYYPEEEQITAVLNSSHDVVGTEDSNKNFEEVQAEEADIANSIKTVENTESIGKAINEALEFLHNHCGEREDIYGIPSILNIVRVEKGICDSAELPVHPRPLPLSLSDTFDLNIYYPSNKRVNAVVYDEMNKELLNSIDQTIKYVGDERRIDRLTGWMLSHPEDSIDYSAGVELPLERSIIEAVNALKYESIDCIESKYLLLLPYAFNASTADTIHTEIERAKRFVNAVKEFDDEYSTSVYERALIPLWQVRADAQDEKSFCEFLNTGSTDSDFWRV